MAKSCGGGRGRGVDEEGSCRKFMEAEFGKVAGSQIQGSFSVHAGATVSAGRQELPTRALIKPLG